MPDSEYIFEVDVPPDVESFSNINTDTNPFEVTVKIKAAGNILSNLDARESLCSKAMTNDATLGICSEFIYDEGCKIEEAVIQFKIDYENAVEADTKKAEDSESYGISIVFSNSLRIREYSSMLQPRSMRKTIRSVQQ